MKIRKPSKTFCFVQLVVPVLIAFLFTGIAMAQTHERPDISNMPYPKAFFFRKTEGDATKVGAGSIPYKSWSDSYQRLDGIMGKALEEEVPGRSVNIKSFTQFKQDHPEQLVLLHYNGNARDPRNASKDFYSGHWIYFTGTTTTKEIQAQTGESDIHVRDSSFFNTLIDRSKNKKIDIGICLLDRSGKPDWRVSEQVQLIGINPQQQTIRVKRGSYNTVPLSFPAGKTYVAAHATTGPFGKDSNLLWLYNFSTHSPRNSKGMASYDVLADDLATQFASGGRLAAFDGIEFDVMNHDRGVGHNLNSAIGLDMDADGKADWGYFNGINTYGLGVIELVKTLRQKLGENFIMLADGTTANSQRALAWINGIESEGWPNLTDPEINEWSSGMNRHRYWARFGRQPVLNYINHKFINADDLTLLDTGSIPFSTNRLVIGAAQMFDAFFTYSLLPPKDGGYLVGIWDELRKGKEDKPGWLGFPKGDPISLAKHQQNLLLGKTPSQMNWQGTTSTIIQEGNLVEIQGQQSQQDIQFLLKNLPARGPDITVAIQMRASPLKGYPKEVPRLAWVGLAQKKLSLIDENVPDTGMKLRGQEEQPIDPTVTERVRFVPNLALAHEVHNAYFSHPPRRGTAGYTFWQRQVEIPPNGMLTFFTGLSQKAATKSDGVTFKVLLKDGTADYVMLFEENIREWKWQKHSVPLTAWANKKVTIKFEADSGPRNNSVADHAHWGDAVIRSGLDTPMQGSSAQFTTYVGEKSFESTFYFRNVQAPTIDLSFTIEGANPVWIESVEVYPYPEVLVRQFDNGLVLVNPSDHAYSFDLAKWAGKASYKRLTASKKQDVAVNNGSKVAGSVLVGPKDSLFLIRDNAGQ